MSRVGQNPMRWVSDVQQPQRITVAALVFIPHLLGYWSGSLEVLELCLGSLRENTAEPFDLLVFDNGSCPEVRRFLARMRERKEIQLLMLSDRNLGKTGAWNLMFRAAPGDIVVYTDSDVYFQRGWLELSLEDYGLALLLDGGFHEFSVEDPTPEKVDCEFPLLRRDRNVVVGAPRIGVAVEPAAVTAHFVPQLALAQAGVVRIQQDVFEVVGETLSAFGIQPATHR